MEWRIYYGDGSTFSDEDGGPELAPTLNVQAIVQVENDVDGGRQVLNGRDYYIWLGEEHLAWDVVDLFGCWDYLQRPGWKRVLFGRTIPTADYNAVMQRAGHDSDFLHLARPPKLPEW